MDSTNDIPQSLPAVADDTSDENGVVASAPTATPSTQQGNNQLQVPAISVPADDTTLPAEDVDLIEKAWVQKAKAIVRQTYGDPYSQNKQLNSVRAEYISKRFNRQVRTSE